MKKFCKNCGNQLELSQRFCSECGTVNPFFVQAFTFISDQSEALEKLKQEKERIEKELKQKEEEQAEFNRQEQLRKEKEAAEKAKAGKGKDKKSVADTSAAENENLKKELLRVKEETFELVKEVREELQQLEQESKQIKQEVEILHKIHVPEKKEDVLIASTQPLPSPALNEKRILVSVFLIALALLSLLAFFYFTREKGDTITDNAQLPAKEFASQPENIPPPVDTLAETGAVEAPADSAASFDSPPSSSPAVVTTPTIVPNAEAKIQPQVFMPDAERVKNDLVGKKLTGCDIVVASLSEISEVSGITQAGRLTAGNLKFKAKVVVTQGGETYHATPYLYYTPDGAFIRVDGTNCE